MQRQPPMAVVVQAAGRLKSGKVSKVPCLGRREGRGRGSGRRRALLVSPASIRPRWRVVGMYGSSYRTTHDPCATIVVLVVSLSGVELKLRLHLVVPLARWSSSWSSLLSTLPLADVSHLIGLTPPSPGQWRAREARRGKQPRNATKPSHCCVIKREAPLHLQSPEILHEHPKSHTRLSVTAKYHHSPEPAQAVSSRGIHGGHRAPRGLRTSEQACQVLRRYVPSTRIGAIQF